MKAPITTFSLCASAALGLLSSTAFAADGHITYLEEVGSGDRPMILAASDRGIAFIGADHTLFRTYAHAQTAFDPATQPFLWVQDIDGDNRSEFVGAGVPSFVIDDNGDPMWGVLEGCDSYYVADFIDDSTQELMCVRGANVAVWSYDGQEYFNTENHGYSIASCASDDFDGDRKSEVACSLTDGNHLFFDVEDWFNDELYDPLREGPAPSPETVGGVDVSEMAAIAAGEQTIRVGAREVTLGFAGGALQLAVDGAPAATVQIGGSGIYSATSADLDRDGIAELYVGGDDAVHIIHLDGTLVASVTANPSATTRDARVTVRSATANGLEESDRDAVKAIVEEELDALTSCYSRRMGSDQFTRVGTMLWELSVSSSGSVSDAQKRHSGVRNESLESCVADVLEDLRFSSPSEDSGSVSVTLEFDFVDR